MVSGVGPNLADASQPICGLVIGLLRFSQSMIASSASLALRARVVMGVGGGAQRRQPPASSEPGSSVGSKDKSGNFLFAL